MSPTENLHEGLTGEVADDMKSIESIDENVMPADKSSHNKSSRQESQQPVFDDNEMAQIMPGEYHSDGNEGADKQTFCSAILFDPEIVVNKAETDPNKSKPDRENENENESSPADNSGLISKGFSLLTGWKASSETPLSDSAEEIKRLRNKLDKSEKNSRKAEKAATERDIALADTQKKLRNLSNKLRDYESVLDDNHRTMKKMNDQINLARREVRRKENDLDEERFHRRKQGEEFKRLADAKRETEAKGKEKEKELSGKVFELTGGSFNATQDQLRGMLQSWRGGINNIAPNFFTRIGELDLEDDDQAVHFCQNLTDMDFKILMSYGSEVYYYLCESWLFRSILEHITNIFCVGSREALGTNGGIIDEGLRLLYDAVDHSPAKDILDAKFLHQTWKATTIRMLLSLQQVPINYLADKSSHGIILSKSPFLTAAIKSIAEKVAKDTERYMLVAKPKSDRQMKKLFDVVANAVFLGLNCRVISDEITFMMPAAGDKIVNVWMECVGSTKEGTSDKDGSVVLIPISAAIWKRRSDGDWDIVAKAKVFPVSSGEMRRVNAGEVMAEKRGLGDEGENGDGDVNMST